MNKFSKAVLESLSDNVKKDIGLVEYEEDIQLKVVAHIKKYYPDVVFQTNPYSGMKQTKYQAIKAKKLGHISGFPDLQIYKPSKGYNGLFVELKKEDVKLFKKDGNYVSEHIQKQAELLKRLTDNNYYACFCIGYQKAIETIDWYLL